MAKKTNPTPVVEAAAGVNTDQVLKDEQITATEKAEGEKAAAAEKAEADKAETDKAEADKAAADKAASEEVHEAQLIPSGIFVAENGDSFEFAVGQFTFQGKVYTKEEALSDHTDVLEHLISVKSFILKKV